jgi:hypothetical protein
MIYMLSACGSTQVVIKLVAFYESESETLSINTGGD